LFTRLERDCDDFRWDTGVILFDSFINNNPYLHKKYVCRCGGFGTTFERRGEDNTFLNWDARKLGKRAKPIIRVSLSNLICFNANNDLHVFSIVFLFLS